MAKVCPIKLRAAIHKDTIQVTDIVREREQSSTQYALAQIPDGGDIELHSNSDTIIYGTAHQDFREYKEVDYADKDLIPGEMTGLACTGRNGVFDTDVNDIKDNACSGECIIEFGQGFRRRHFKNFDIKPKTPIICSAELAGRGEDHVAAWYRDFVENFTNWGMDNFEANLLNAIIRYGEANFSVQTADYFDVTAGGFVAPPINRMSIHALRQYKIHMIRAKGLPASGMLEIEMPRQDWIDAVRYDQVRTNPGVVIQTELFKDTEGPLKDREFGVYDGIKCYFNDIPVRGYFKQTGQTNGGQKLYKFVRIYPWINIPGEEAGLVSRPNYSYDKDFTYCEGQRYDLCNLAFVINPKSFKRYGLEEVQRPGGQVVSNNYTVTMRDGAWLSGGTDCGNDYNEKFRLVARHQYRLTMPYPEWSGCLAYRASRIAGYVLPACAVVEETVTQEFATGPVFADCGGPGVCQEAACVACGKVADANGQCVASGSEVLAVLTFEPCGSFQTPYTNPATGHDQVVVRVRRVGTSRGAASVSYTITDTAGAGLATTPEHYSDVSTVPGTLSWADGDGDDQLILLNIVGASGDAAVDLAFTITLASATGATLSTNCHIVVGHIEDHSV